MPQSQVVVIKVPTGSQPPLGYTFVRTIRDKDIYNKTIPKITTRDIDDLDVFFTNMNMNGSENVAIVPESNMDGFIQSLEQMSLGGRRKGSIKRKGLRKVKKSRKGRKSLKSKKRRY